MALGPLHDRNIIGGKNAATMVGAGVPFNKGVSQVLNNARHHPGGFANGGSTTNIPGIKFKNLSVNDVASALSPQVLSSLNKNTPSGLSAPQQQASNAYYPPRKPEITSGNTPMYGGLSRGGMAPQHMASGGLSFVAAPSPTPDPSNTLPTSTQGPPSQSVPYSNFVQSVPVGGTSGTPTSSAIAQIGSNGIPIGNTPGSTTSTPTPVAAPPTLPAATVDNSDQNSQVMQNFNQTGNLFEPNFGGAVQLFNKGGSPHMANGGFPSSSEAAPWFARAEARGEDSPIHTGGILPGNTGGRTDVLNKTVPAGSYVLPADVVSGLGEGNTNAGAHVLDTMMHTLPYGIKGGGGKRSGMGIPRPPAAAKIPALNLNQVKRGGAPHNGGDEHVPVVLAAGEYLVPKEKVTALGGGNIKHGHKILDHFVVHVRNKTADTMKKLPGPKK